MGALVGLDLAAREPDRIAGLVLLGAAPKMPVHPALLEAAARPERLAAELICDWGFGPAGHFGGHKAPGSWMLGHALRLLAASTGPRLHTDLIACNAYEDGLQAAAKLRCPTLLVAGAADRMTPAREGAKLAEAIKGAQLVTLPALRAYADARAAGRDARCADRISGKVSNRQLPVARHRPSLGATNDGRPRCGERMAEVGGDDAQAEVILRSWRSRAQALRARRGPTPAT